MRKKKKKKKRSSWNAKKTTLKRGEKKILLEQKKIMQRHGLERKRTNNKGKETAESKAKGAVNKCEKEKKSSKVNQGKKGQTKS